MTPGFIDDKISGLNGNYNFYIKTNKTLLLCEKLL